MSTFLERLLAETNELQDRLNKLQTFLASDKFDELDEEHQTLLNLQASSMGAYLYILQTRLSKLMP